MSKTKKIIIIAAVITLLAGIIIAGIAAGLIFIDVKDSSGGFFSILNDANTVEYISNTYEAVGEFENIDIRCTESNIRFVLSEESTVCRVECVETEKVTHKVEVRDNTLFITVEDNRTWRDQVGIAFGSISATVHLPKNAFQLLNIETVSGDILIPDNFAFSDAEFNTTSGDITFMAQIGHNGTDGIGLTVESTSGDITIASESAIEKLYINTTSGDVSVRDITADDISIHTTSGQINAGNITAGRNVEDDTTADGTCTISTSSGDVTLTDSHFGECSISTASGVIKLISSNLGNCRISTSSGDVRFEGADAETYTIETSSGDVRGSIRSYKNFIVETASGDIDIPTSHYDEPDCRISTASGDIDIEVIPE